MRLHWRHGRTRSPSHRMAALLACTRAGRGRRTNERLPDHWRGPPAAPGSHACRRAAAGTRMPGSDATLQEPWLRLRVVRRRVGRSKAERASAPNIRTCGSAASRHSVSRCSAPGMRRIVMSRSKVTIRGPCIPIGPDPPLPRLVFGPTALALRSRRSRY